MKKSTLFWNPFFQYATFLIFNIVCLAIIAFTAYHMIGCQRFFGITETPFPLLLDTACTIIDPIVNHPWGPLVILISSVMFEILYGKSNKKYIRLAVLSLLSLFVLTLTISVTLGSIQALSKAIRSPHLRKVIEKYNEEENKIPNDGVSP